jgi:large subunit ribosomal protein L4
MEIVNNKIELPIVDFGGKEVGKTELAPEIFGVEPHDYSVQLAVKVDLANRRQATAKTKTVSEVRGTGKKPWKQKGTGRARVGTRRSPLWRGGGIVFGPTGEQNFKIKMTKKEHALALASVLSDKVASKSVMVLDSDKFASPKTKDLVKALKVMGLTEKTLIVIDEFDENFLRAVANIPNVTVDTSDNMSVYDILNCTKLVFTKSVIEDINSQFADDEEAK